MQKLALVFLVIAIIITSILLFLVWKNSESLQNYSTVASTSQGSINQISQNDPGAPSLSYEPNRPLENWIGKTYDKKNIKIITLFYRQSPTLFPLVISSDQGNIGINFNKSNNDIIITIGTTPDIFKSSSFPLLASHIIASVLKTEASMQSDGSGFSKINIDIFNANTTLLSNDPNVFDKICVKIL